MSNLLDVLQFTADKTLELANANSVVGERIEVDGLTVIPVSKLSVGFAGGGADMNNSAKKSSQSPAGAGAKVKVEPYTFIVIEEGKAKLINVDAPKSSPLQNLVPLVLEKFKKNK